MGQPLATLLRWQVRFESNVLLVRVRHRTAPQEQLRGKLLLQK